MKAKHQRLVLAAVAALAVLVAVLLAMSALSERASYFYAPADLAGRPLPLDRAVRVGGVVEQASLETEPDGLTIRFRLTDESGRSVPVRFTGIVPDLFREGSGAIAEGRFRPDGTFVADEILAKHDETYRPPEEAGDRHKVESLR